jgi:putative ABC transport system permease protein
VSFTARVGSNIGRHPTRTFGVLLIVALTLGIFLVLSQVSASVQGNANQAVSAVQNIVTVQLVNNSYGGGTFSISIGAGVPPSEVNQIASATGVASVQRITFQPEQVNPGSPICGSNQDPNVQAMDTDGPIFLLLGGLSGATSVSISEGRDLTSGDSQSHSAIVGSEYASDNGLGVGSPLTLNGEGFSVVGIFSAGSCTAGGETVIVPFPSGTSALGTNNATIVFAYLSQGASIQSVVGSLQSHLGTGYTVQSLANANHNALQAALGSILSGAEFAEYAALASGALIIVTIMVVVTSQRTREFGLMKALGYGNRRILAQVSLESLLVAFAGLPMAIAVAILLGPAIAQWAIGGAASGYVGQQLLSGSEVDVTADLIVLGALVTSLFGLLGCVYPSVRALRLAPTEALRDE